MLMRTVSFLHNTVKKQHLRTDVSKKSKLFQRKRFAASRNYTTEVKILIQALTITVYCSILNILWHNYQVLSYQKESHWSKRFPHISSQSIFTCGSDHSHLPHLRNLVDLKLGCLIDQRDLALQQVFRCSTFSLSICGRTLDSILCGYSTRASIR